MACLEVPYKLAENCACSIKAWSARRALNSSVETKWYSFPSVSPARGCLVVSVEMSGRRWADGGHTRHAKGKLVWKVAEEAGEEGAFAHAGRAEDDERTSDRHWVCCVTLCHTLVSNAFT